MAVGYLVNDLLTAIPGTRTFWHDLLDWIPGLENKTGTDYHGLASYIETLPEPDYIIRNGSYFRKINTKARQISLIQDIGFGSEVQLEVARSSDFVVFNSRYCESFYQGIELNARIIPLGTNFDLFHPMDSQDELRRKHGIENRETVIFVGALSEIKGSSKLLSIVESSNLQFIFVLKDMGNYSNPNVKVFNMVTQETLCELINCANIGICTSQTETQHLAGIEIGACGKPIVTTNVGAYWNRDPGVWGNVSDGDFVSDIKRLLTNDNNPSVIRHYWRGFDLEHCRNAWVALVNECVSL